MDGNDVFVPITVLLETEWVLRSAYRFAPDRVVQGLRSFAGLPRVTLEDPGRAARAPDWCEQGMDFADALHLAAADATQAFATFDTEFARSASRVTGADMRQP